MSMKKIAWILVVIAMIVGCSEARNPLLKEAAEIVHQRPDSARVLINKVDTTALSEADKMEYRLLTIMTDYIVLHQADGDSLITTCVDYYDKHGDDWQRGRAYYYRGGIRRHLLGKTFDAIKDYKVAETIAEDADDELLKNMVYENLAFANYYCFTHPLILEYSQKFLESSLKLNDSVMTLRALQMCASSYSYMDQSDSAYAYFFRSMDYIDLADSILRADIYHNIAAMYQEQGDDENARKYLEKWKNDKTAISFKGYLIEARLLEAQGHYKEALERVKKSLSEKDPLVRSHAMDVVSRLYEKTGDMGAALDIKRQKDTYTDSIMKANHSLEIADWQRKYDEARWKERSYQRMVKLGGAFLLFLTVMMMGYWWYWRRVQGLTFRLDENARQIAENQAEIERLQQSGEASEQTIANLKKQIENNRQIISNKLLIGTRCFVKLQQKESVADITADEKQCLITYYAQLRPKRWQEWEHTYVSLTTTQYIFLILQEDLHYDDDTIAQILGVKPASLRTLRSRIKGRGK